jgi:hypothetical protein
MNVPMRCVAVVEALSTAWEDHTPRLKAWYVRTAQGLMARRDAVYLPEWRRPPTNAPTRPGNQQPAASSSSSTPLLTADEALDPLFAALAAAQDALLLLELAVAAASDGPPNTALGMDLGARGSFDTARQAVQCFEDDLSAKALMLLDVDAMATTLTATAGVEGVVGGSGARRDVDSEVLGVYGYAIAANAFAHPDRIAPLVQRLRGVGAAS